MSPRNAVRLVALFAFAFCLFGMSEDARAQSIEDARTKWFEADFEGSRDEFRRVLASPSLTPTQALDAHRFLAVIHLALREDDAARAHADAAVALDPSSTPPEGAPRGS